jgi:hypothetical protein
MRKTISSRLHNRKTIEVSAKMEAEHFYHCLSYFCNGNPKNNWEKNELQDALKEQYMKLLNSDFTAKKVITDTSKRNPDVAIAPVL